MRVRGPPPSQGIHIAKAVQEGMRAMFRGAASPTSRSVSDPSEGSITAAAPEPSIQYEASDPSLLEEYVKVQSSPLFLVLNSSSCSEASEERPCIFVRAQHLRRHLQASLPLEK